MNRWEKWSFHILAVVVSGTGLVYFWMKYFLESGDPFSVVNHSWQPLMLELHILASPLLILVMGIILSSHIQKKLRGKNGPNRRSGWITLLSFPVMALSGYLLQVVSQPAVLRIVLVIHLASSAVFVAGYILHEIISFRLRRGLAAQEQQTGSLPAWPRAIND